MPDPRQTVESIRAYLQTDNTGLSAQLLSLATDYAELARDANLRLRRCADFLREGLLGEAVNFASAKPPLVDLVAALDFAELPEWERTCTSYGLAWPGRLPRDTAEELKQAAARVDPLRELLDKHRYLALANAPLTERLAVIRQIISADPVTEVWKRQAMEFDQARLMQLRNEAAAAIRAGDVAHIDRLLIELNTSPWQIPIPAELNETLERSSLSLRQASALADLTALIPSVREAYASQSYDQCQQVFARWARVVTSSRLIVPPELRQEIAPLAIYIDEQEELRGTDKQFRTVCGALLEAVETDEPLAELKRVYRLIEDFNRDIPDEVSAAYRRGLKNAQRRIQAEKNKQIALTAILIGGIILALAVLAFVIVSANWTKH